MSNNYEHVKASRTRLKERIVYVMGSKCQQCGYDKCISALELHHVNPQEKEFTVSANANRSWSTIVPEIAKCTLVCANCHREIEAGLISSPPISFNQDKADEISNLIEDIKTHKINYCIDCGKEIYKGAQRCPECAAKAKRTVERPNREELKEMIRTIPFTHISKKYNVSDKAITKWCIAENLPHRKKDINAYSDEEWALI